MKRDYELLVTSKEGIQYFIYFQNKDLNFVYHECSRILEIIGVSFRMANLSESDFSNFSEFCEVINRAFKERIQDKTMKIFTWDEWIKEVKII